MTRVCAARQVRYQPAGAAEGDELAARAGAFRLRLSSTGNVTMTSGVARSRQTEKSLMVGKAGLEHLLSSQSISGTAVARGAPRARGGVTGQGGFCPLSIFLPPPIRF